jgi:GntR family transcriptional repressor for pyruvate dehydrogenase complex
MVGKWKGRMRLAAPNPFQPVHKMRAPRAIEVQVRALIAEGKVHPGDRLPSERVLAQALGVGRATLREAIRILEVVGLLNVRPGEGTFVAAPAAQPSPGLDATAIVHR